MCSPIMPLPPPPPGKEREHLERMRAQIKRQAILGLLMVVVGAAMFIAAVGRSLGAW